MQMGNWVNGFVFHSEINKIYIYIYIHYGYLLNLPALFDVLNRIQAPNILWISGKDSISE